MDSVKKFSALREEVMNGNVEIAQKTLKLQPKLQDLQVQVQEMRASLRQKQEELATKQTRQQKVVAKFHAEALLDKVSASAKEDDTISDDIAHKFTNGESNVTQFIAEYIPLRKRYHERTIKFNKLLQVG
jgi:ESCRT-I complex subunit VPS37